MDLREITQHLCFRYQEHFEERDEEDTLYNFSLKYWYHFLSPKMHKWTNALTLSTNSTNYIKQFDISW